MAERIVIKCGSQLMINPDHAGGVLRQEFIAELFGICQQFMSNGIQVVLVLSGAVGAGKQIPALQTKQAQAAAGQLQLSRELPLSLLSGGAALLLLTRFDVSERERYATLSQTVHELLAAGIVPIFNENDATTAAETVDFADNDHLAALLSITVRANRLFLLTDVDGVYSAHPDVEGAELFSQIENVNLELLKMATGGKSALGRGGMVGKLKAARLATSAGVQTHIMSGAMVGTLPDLLLGTKQIGTVCLPRTRAEMLGDRERWLMSAKTSDGSISVDAGAAKAVRARKTLLAVGMKNVYGKFDVGDSVEILDEKKETVAIGLVEQSSETLRVALQAPEKPFDMDVVHANNLILL